MTISNVTTLSSFTDNAPLSPAYFNGKWEEARSNFSRLADAAQSTLSGAGLLFASEYGVAANGTTDDTSAVQNVLTTAAATGKTAVFSAGTHRLVGPISFPSNVKAQGVGKDGTIFLAGTAAMTTISTASSDVRVDGIYFKGTGATNSGERGIDTAAARVRVTNCRFGRLTSGVRFSGTAATDGLVHGCEFKEIVGSFGVSEGYGVQVSGARIVVSNNHFDDVMRHAVYLASTASGCVVSHNVISRLSQHAIQVYATSSQSGCYNNVIHGNVISDLTQAVGIRVADFCHDTIISNNVVSRLTGNNSYPIYVSNGVDSSSESRCKRTIITGNKLENVVGTFDVILLQNVDDVLVTGNMLSGNSTGYGIQVATASAAPAEAVVRNVLIDGNHISGCTYPIYLNGSAVSGVVVGVNSYHSNSFNTVRNTATGVGFVPTISSTSSLIGAFVVQGSASSFTIVTWPQAQANDIIWVTPTSLNGAVSSLSSGIVAHSHCTQNGQVELRLSNCSTLAQNVSSKTWYFTRITPF